MSTLMILASDNTLAVQRVTPVTNVNPPLPDGTVQYIVANNDDLKQLPTRLLLQAYNATRATPIKGFHDREKAERQGYEALQALAAKHGEPVEAPTTTTAQEGEPMATATKTKNTRGKKATKPAATTRQHRLINMEPTATSKEDVRPARAGSKTAIMIDLLAEGATLPQLAAALSERGRPVNARAWVTGFGRFGYGVKAVDEKAELPTYRLVYPKGMRQPLPHRTPKSGDEAE